MLDDDLNNASRDELALAYKAAAEERDNLRTEVDRLRSEVVTLRFDNNVLRRAMEAVEDVIGRALSAREARQDMARAVARHMGLLS